MRSSNPAARSGGNGGDPQSTWPSMTQGCTEHVPRVYAAPDDLLHDPGDPSPGGVNFKARFSAPVSWEPGSANLEKETLMSRLKRLIPLTIAVSLLAAA